MFVPETVTLALLLYVQKKVLLPRLLKQLLYTSRFTSAGGLSQLCSPRNRHIASKVKLHTVTLLIPQEQIGENGR